MGKRKIMDARKKEGLVQRPKDEVKGEEYKGLT